MARTGFCGFGSNDALVDSGGNHTSLPSGFTFDATTKRTGGFSLKCVAASGSVSQFQTMLNIGAPDYFRIVFLFSSLPSSTRIFAGTNPGYNLRVKPTGEIELRRDTTVIATSTTQCTNSSKWYVGEFRTTAGSTYSASPALKIDSEVINGTSNTNASYDGKLGAGDTVAAAFTVFFADIGADAAAFMGDEKVILGFTISDNARAAKWTGGAGGTTNLWDAVNQLGGLASASATNTSQIEHSGSGAGNEDYDANMTTYTNMGIGASDTINAIRAVIVHGEDIATGTKTLTFAVKSNPAGSFETAFNAGDDVGAVGTHPTNWKQKYGTIISSPSVTNGNSPVVSVRRNGTESRVASVEFVGLYVSYTPTSVTPVDLGSGTVRL